MAKTAQKTADVNIDLIPKSEPTGASGETVHWALTVGRYLIIFTEIIALSTFVIALFLSKQKNDLRESVKSKQQIVNQYQNCNVEDEKEFCEDRFRKIQGQINQVAQLSDSQFQTNKVVSDFLAQLPVGIKLDNLAIDKNTITFSGTLPTEAELQTLITSFNSSTKINALDITTLSKEVDSLRFSASAFINRSSYN